MPRAAVLSLHARLEGVEPTSWAHPELAQLWGPRYSTYVVPKADFGVFSLGRLPDTAKGRERAERMAELVRIGKIANGMNQNALKYGATTGTIAIRWEGARAPKLWSVERPKLDPAEARRELARRYLRVFGPTTAESFARWAGISRPAGANAFASLGAELLPVRSPLGDEWLLAADEPELAAAARPAPVRLLPSGDAYFLLDGRERELLVPDAKRRALLWTPRVWPGALLVDGEVRGTWRRAQHVVRVEAWERVPREAVETEARSLPLPGLERELEVVWS